jgi:hypothetical protein
MLSHLLSVGIMKTTKTTEERGEIPSLFLLKKNKKILKKLLTNCQKCAIMYTERKREVNNNERIDLHKPNKRK